MGHPVPQVLHRGSEEAGRLAGFVPDFTSEVIPACEPAEPTYCNPERQRNRIS